MRNMHLNFAPVGVDLRVIGIRGGPGCHGRLADMGLVPGAELRVLHGHGHGPVLIDLKGSRVALGRGMAHKIMVEEEKL